MFVFNLADFWRFPITLVLPSIEKMFDLDLPQLLLGSAGAQNCGGVHRVFEALVVSAFLFGIGLFYENNVFAYVSLKLQGVLSKAAGQNLFGTIVAILQLLLLRSAEVTHGLYFNFFGSGSSCSQGDLNNMLVSVDRCSCC